MAVGWPLICFVIASGFSWSSVGVEAQQLSYIELSGNGICKSIESRTLSSLVQQLKECVVVWGNLQVTFRKLSDPKEFQNITFPKLRQVTGFVVLYRVGVQSLGQLFPNLTRIRGTQLLHDYGLVAYDMQNLIEIGLYSLIKIDRGGVIIWGGPQTCNMDTVDWEVIAPGARHVLRSSDTYVRCSPRCSCSRDPATNRCWNNKKCQRFTEGPDAETCNEQCLGCRKTKRNECSVCRYHTYRGRCVSQCPANTIVMSDNQYCITVKECKELEGWQWNKTCVSQCPPDYIKFGKHQRTTCKLCENCQATCPSQFIQSLEAIQAAEKCVYIIGSLTIHIRAIPGVMQELRIYLSRIQNVTDYVLIYGSVVIDSLDFLSSLRHIGGGNLKNGKYSLLIYDMQNLQTLFSNDVTKNLKIDNGTLKVYGNPMLCMNHVDKLKKLFKAEPSEIDVPWGMNGYSENCGEVSVGLDVIDVSETTAHLTFHPNYDDNVHYTILYVNLPPVTKNAAVPQTCSDYEWDTMSIPPNFAHLGKIVLKSLRPASTYAICIEVYDSVLRQLFRSSVVSFTTLVGKPEPPFIFELVASSSNDVIVRWVDHKDYRPHITHYKLDVALIDYNYQSMRSTDHCKNMPIDGNLQEIDYSRHASVMRPPPDYTKGCESMCGVLSTATVGAMVEEYFDVCSESIFGCESIEDFSGNTTFKNFVKTMTLDIKSPKNNYQVGDLAPYRDYRFRLRACALNNCSRSTRGVVRTLPLKTADVPSLTNVTAIDSGDIVVKWRRPTITNGPLLAYYIDILPEFDIPEKGNILPQSWCVLSQQLNLTVKSITASIYNVRVCSKTLVSSSTCSEWKTIKFETRQVKKSIFSWWWAGISVGVILWVLPIILLYVWRSHRGRNDEIPLIDGSDTLGIESESPASMLTDFAPLYTITLTDISMENMTGGI